MKKIIYGFIAFWLFSTAYAQVLDPVKWKTKVEQKSETEFVLVMDAKIDNGWHFYSQNTPDGGALPAVFTFKDAKGNYQLIGKTTEGKYEKHFNDVFEVEEYFFTKSAQFKQTIKVVNPKLKAIKASLEGQTCIDGKCIQENVDFTFTLPEIKVAETTEVVDSVATIPIMKDTVTTKTQPKEEVVKAVTTNKPSKKTNKSLWTIFLLSFLGGFAALLMPCIFPMIPMTVSFFTKQSKSKAEGIRNAVVYGVSIIAIYVLLGSIITGVFGAEALNELSTSVWFNLIFFALLVIFALYAKFW